MKRAAIIALLSLAICSGYICGQNLHRMIKHRSITETDYYNCAAMVARAAEGGPSQCFAPSWKEYYGALVRFQDGYENTALGHDTIMYAWKEKGKALCASMAEHDQKPEFPAEAPNCPPPHNRAPVIVDRFE